MNTRGIRVHAHADEQPRSVKILFPWRDAVKGPIAKMLLAKHVLLNGLHLLKGTPKVGEKWNNLVAVFKKEPQIAEFMLGVSTELSGENLQKQFYSILDEKEAWLESGNKSGKEGDLDEDNVALRQIMMDLEDQETDKK